MATEYIGPIYNPTPVDEEKIPLAGIRIQPNPATDHILVSGLSPDARIELFSLTGTQILILHPVGSTTSVALGTIPPGIYVVKIREGNEVAFRKIVKTR